MKWSVETVEIKEYESIWPASVIVSCPGPGVRRSRFFASHVQLNETLAVSRPTCCVLQHINIVNWNSSDIQISNKTLSVSWNLHKVRSSAFSSSICSDMSSNRWAHLQKSPKMSLAGVSSNPAKPWKTLTIARTISTLCFCFTLFCLCWKGPQPYSWPPTRRHHTLAFLPTAGPQALMLSSAPPCWKWQYMMGVYHLCNVCQTYIYIYIHHNMDTYIAHVSSWC